MLWNGFNFFLKFHIWLAGFQMILMIFECNDFTIFLWPIKTGLFPTNWLKLASEYTLRENPLISDPVPAVESETVVSFVVKLADDTETWDGYLQEKFTKSPTFFPFTTLMLLTVAENGLEIENFWAKVTNLKTITRFLVSGNWRWINKKIYLY